MGAMRSKDAVTAYHPRFIDAFTMLVGQRLVVTI